MEEFHYISSTVLDIETIWNLIQHKTKLRLSDEAKVNIEKCRKYLDQKLASDKTPVYGINTGFGSLCNVRIAGKIGRASCRESVSGSAVGVALRERHPGEGSTQRALVLHADDGIRDFHVTGVQTCALPILIQHKTKLSLSDEAKVNIEKCRK